MEKRGRERKGEEREGERGVSPRREMGRNILNCAQLCDD